ncbi:MAG: carboxypeptidase-like regulatory domain-containing protein [Bacteroidales bacterium]|nr:carboxypeptidase-like regulatory domain-containing protein [Bacteroidales bacterium]
MFFNKISFTLCLLLFSAAFGFAGNVKGKVYDNVTNESLPGATIVIEGTNRGVVTDILGEFIMSDVSPGDYNLQISFLGYEQQVISVTVSDDKPTIINVPLSSLVIIGEEIVVTAQAAGQRAAINQQINSNSVTSVVSAQLIREIPESSAAEAVGRLPGVSLKGNSIVARGLSPHYNKIQVDGTDMASTNGENRSSSLDMISQYMLEGIEMSKTAMAEHEADVLGARVNLLIKEAPEKPRMEAIFQNGWNSLSESLGNQKISLSGSNRFFDNKFGVFAQLSYDRTNWASNQMTAGYSVNEITDSLPSLENLSLTQINGNMVGRQGASLVMDYKSGLSKIKMSNFMSGKSTEKTTRQISYGRLNLREGRNLNFNTSELFVMTNALRYEQVIGRFEIDAGIHHAYSKNNVPENISANGIDIGAMILDTLINNSVLKQHPLVLPNYSNLNMEEAYMQAFRYNTAWNKEQKYTANIDVKTNLKFGSHINMDIKVGAKYKRLNKEKDSENYEAQTHQAYFQMTRDVAHEYLDWFPVGGEAGSPEGGNVGMRYFVDQDYYDDEFLLGDYVISNILDETKVREFHEFMVANPMGFELGQGKPYYKLWKESYVKDYHGEEEYFGAYFMPTVTVGKNNLLTLIPGVRYEKNKTTYTGYRLPQVHGMDRDAERTEYADYHFTRERENEFILPMMHLILRPLKFVVIKSSYTHTLSRPQFADLVPSWNIDNDFVTWNDPYLEPALSKNLDLNISLHGSKIGLFSAGVFQKEIKNLIFYHGETSILQEDLDANKYEDLKENNEYTLVNLAGLKIDYKMNNPEISYVKGIELEYQSNFYFLPGLLKGLVLNANYTLFDSEAKYPDTKAELDFQTFQWTYTDTFFVSRFLDQARHIFNVMIGFDYKDFSIRGSFKYTDDVFSKNHNTPNLRNNTDARYDIDLTAKQDIPKIGLTVFCNLTNLLRSRYAEINNSTGYPAKESYGGLSAELGLRYRFKQK